MTGKLVSWVFDAAGFRVNRYQQADGSETIEVTRDDARRISDLDRERTEKWYREKIATPLAVNVQAMCHHGIDTRYKTCPQCDEESSTR